MDQPATKGTVYKQEVEMAGIRRGQGDLCQELRKARTEEESGFEWLHVSVRSQRAIRAIFDLLRQEYKISKEIEKGDDEGNDQMVAIRHEPLRIQWERVNYMTHF